MMKRRMIVAVFMLGWLLTGAFSPHAPAKTGGPIIWRQAVDDSFISSKCSFPMQVETTGTGVFHLFLDSDGNFERVIITEPTMRITFTNLDTGKSIWTPTVNMVEE